MAKFSHPRILSPLWWGLGLVVATCAASPASASEQFDNQVVQFGKDTIVEFEFVESRNAYQSTFGVINLNTGEKTPLLREVKHSDDDLLSSAKEKDFLATPNNAVPVPMSEFTFQANTPYSFYLESSYRGKKAGIVYSSDALNQGRNRQAKLDQNMGGLENSQGIKINFDDTGSVLVQSNKDDMDFNDFTVIAGGFKACPHEKKEPFPPQPELPTITPEAPATTPVVPKAPRARG
jgi:hypothetical protein